MPILETERLVLRSFRAEDVDAMAQLFANPDFTCFSLGVYTERKKTVDFIDKVMSWDRAGIPSLFAVIPRGDTTIVGYCGFHHHPEIPGEVGYPIASRLLESRLDHCGRARCARPRLCGRKTAARHFAGSSGKYPVTLRGGKKWNESRKGNYFSGVPDAGVRDDSRRMAGEP
jgi:Acetyltransferase (GNAT) domain